MKICEFNATTGEERYFDNGKPEPTPSLIPAVKGIDLNKLKAILKVKGIITDVSEVE